MNVKDMVSQYLNAKLANIKSAYSPIGNNINQFIQGKRNLPQEVNYISQALKNKPLAVQAPLQVGLGFLNSAAKVYQGGRDTLAQAAPMARNIRNPKEFDPAFSKAVSGLNEMGYGAFGLTPPGVAFNAWYSGGAGALGNAVKGKPVVAGALQGFAQQKTPSQTLGIKNELVANAVDLGTMLVGSHYIGKASETAKFMNKVRKIDPEKFVAIDPQAPGAFYDVKSMSKIADTKIAPNPINDVIAKNNEEIITMRKFLRKNPEYRFLSDRLNASPTPTSPGFVKPSEFLPTQKGGLKAKIPQNKEGKNISVGGLEGNVASKGLISESQIKPNIEPQLSKPLPKVPLKPSALAPLSEKTLASEQSIAQGVKERGFVSTVKEAPVTKPEVAKTVKGYYTPITNKQTLANAENSIDLLGWEKAKTQALSGPHTAENVALGEALAKKSMETGRFEEATQILDNMSIKATQGGQATQAFSIWSRFTPEGMVKYANQEITKANNTMPTLNKIFGKKVEFTPQDSEAIYNMMKKVGSTPEGPAKIQATKDVFEYISKKLPWGVSNVLDEFRYNNMLSNPLTHLRNAINNLQQAFIVRPATLAASGKPLEAAKYEMGALKSLPDAIDAFKGSMKGNAQFAKMDITDMGSQLRVPKKLGKYNLPSDAMEAMDKFFSKIISSGEQARGATTEEAGKMAEYSLFRGELKPTEQGYMLNKIDDVTKAVYQLRKVGLGWFIPFIRTPMNVAKQWIEYSPLGVGTIPGSANGKEQLGKALLGSLATLVGADLALQGRTTWAPPTDPMQKKLFYDSGRKPYSVKVGNTWVPMQTFGVFAWALGLPASVQYFSKESQTATSDDQITKAAKMVLSPLGFWSQQTFVSGLGSFVSMASGDTDYTLSKNIGYTVSQLKPMEGLMRYVANVVDPIFRKPKGITDQLKSDIPFLTKQLPASTTALGEPSKRNLSNYVAPYAMGVSNPQYENMYQQRTTKLQSNSMANAMQKQAQNNEGVVTSTNPNIKTLPDGRVAYIIDGEVKTAKTQAEAELNIAKNDFASSDKNYQEYNGTVFRRDAQNNVTAVPKVKFDYQLGTAKLTQYKNDENLQEWLKTAKGQLESIQTQLQDPSIDPLDSQTLLNDAHTLMDNIAKYSSYGGFTKPKKPKMIKAPKLKFKSRKFARLKIKPITMSKSGFRVMPKLKAPLGVNLEQLRNPKIPS